MKTLATFLVLLQSNIANENDADAYLSNLQNKVGRDRDYINREDFIKVRIVCE